jgi:hypothetical protein
LEETLNKFSVHKIQRAIFVFALIFIAIACRFPDAVKAIAEAATERCNTVNRNVYESAAINLGQIPEIPDDPESAVYEVCYQMNNPKPVSARMYGGKRSEDNGTTGNVGNDSIPAGTYIGEFYFNEEHSDITELMANEINVNISNSGIVSGTAILQYNNTYISADQCTHYTESGYSYTISGQINGVDRETVEVHQSTYLLTDHSPCGEYKRSNKECSCEGLLTISDGELIIRCGNNSDCRVTLSAKR